MKKTILAAKRGFFSSVLRLRNICILSLFSSISASAETTDQLVYDNPDYTIVLTVKPCPVNKKHYPFNMPFEYEAIAFDKLSSGKGLLV
jgi:hypothetical protein